jgi:hypothetical protein
VGYYEKGGFMNRIWMCAPLVLNCLILFSGCPFEYPPNYHFIETRTVLYKTNIIGISGPSGGGGKYIEIRYSAADDEIPGRNNTKSIMVSPPYIFQNDRVYIRYNLYEFRQADGTVISYKENLCHDYEEGGAEYLQIINHSSDKTIEFFFAGGQDMPDTLEAYKTMFPLTFEHTYSLPSVRYKKAPVQYLLFPNRKPRYNFIYETDSYMYEGNFCGDITIIEPWTVDAVNELYRAEYNRSAEIILFVYNDTGGYYKPKRMIDMVRGSDNECAGKVFWGTIKPGETLEGSDQIWLLATPFMFQDDNSF